MPEKKRYKFIICKVIQKEAYRCAALSPNTVDVVLMPQGLHNTPDKLRREVQKEIDRTDKDPQGRPYNAILLGYGLCSNGIVGLHSELPLIVPRGHDCMTMLLGSRQRYQDYFDTHKGVYWYSHGWIDCSPMPGRERLDRLKQEYLEKYGTDNARFLMEYEHNWIRGYQRAVYIDWDLPTSAEEIAFTQQCAKDMGWQFDQLKGDASLLLNLLDGNWNDSDFLVVQPGYKITEDLTGPGLIKAEKR